MFRNSSNKPGFSLQSFAVFYARTQPGSELRNCDKRALKQLRPAAADCEET